MSNNIHLRDIDIRWEGRDDFTPEGHYLALGKDSLGNTRLWLFQGDTVSDEGYCGSILIPQDAGGRPIAYGPRGSYVVSGHDQAALLSRLANDAAPGEPK
ncbi:hypothetical protein [Nocardia sp. NPDC051833]|uniref:hypothetical protein n=1 Tax=Nocardia sp. NPDC051833 TaxID=3155674 RepID=UPI0034440DE2